jgi:PPOX class probable F420-dependent enzyme
LLDTSRPDDAHTDTRLAAEPVVWLGTTGPGTRPHHVPVWFCWRDPDVLIFSMPATRKVRNLRRNPRVTLTLDSADNGQDIVIADGAARIGAAEAADEMAPLLARKYAAMLGGDAGFAQWRNAFSVPVIVTLSRIVAWTRRGGELRYRSVP